MRDRNGRAGSQYRPADRRRQCLARASRRGAAGAWRARHDQHPPRLRQLGQGQPQGLGPADRPALDHPDAAVRRRQGQERDRHAHDHRRDGPALPRQCRRLRDHVVGQRLPAARPAHPRGRPAGLRLRHRQDARSPSSRPAPASSTSARSRSTDEERARAAERRARASDRSIPSCCRCSASPTRRRSATRRAIRRSPSSASAPRRCRASPRATTATPAFPT